MAPTKKQRMILDAILFLLRRGEIPTVREVGTLVGLRSPSTVLKHLRALESEGLLSLSGKSRGIRIADPDLLAELLAPEDAAAVAAETEGGEPREDGTSASPSAPQGEADRRFYELDPSQIAAERAREVLDTVVSRGNVLQACFSKLTAGVPVLGAIAAGQPIEASTGRFDPPADSDEARPPSLPLDPRLFATSGDLIALRIEGDSMIEAGILHGDYAVVRRQDEVEEGEIAAVLIDGEATLKRWHLARSAGTAGTGAEEDASQRGGAAPAAGRSGGNGSSVRLEPENARFEPLVVTEEDRKEVLVIGKYVGLVRGARIP